MRTSSGCIMTFSRQDTCYDVLHCFVYLLTGCLEVQPYRGKIIKVKKAEPKYDIQRLSETNGIFNTCSFLCGPLIFLWVYLFTLVVSFYYFSFLMYVFRLFHLTEFIGSYQCGVVSIGYNTKQLLAFTFTIFLKTSY